MKHRVIYLAVTIAISLLPHRSLAQRTNIGISGVGLVSWQPADETYVGGPYVDRGLGRVQVGK